MFNKTMTGYTSVDKPQNNGYSFMEKHPVIPNMDVYNAVKLLSLFYKNSCSVNCINLDATYSQLLKDTVTISLALKELGVKKGEIVSISMPNFYQAVATFLACNRIGAVTTFLNSDAEAEEINEYLNLFESPIFINYNKTSELNRIIKDKTKVKHIITLSKNNTDSLSLNGDYHITSDKYKIDFNSLGSISKFQKKKTEINSGKDNSLILFTSGSTGKPKSVVLTNKNILAAGTYLKNSSKVKAINGNKTLVCVPFTYPYGFVTSTLLTLLSGKTAVLAPNMSKDTISYYLKKEPNIIFGSPALLDLIMKNIPDNQDLSSITTFISGGDFLTPAHSKSGKEYFANHGAKDVQMGNGSGNAETVSCGTNPTGIKIRPETAGKILVGTDAMIVDSETMEEKKYGEEGLLCVAGQHVFKEYYREPKLTDEAKFIRNGKEYFKTGTMGFVDKEGYFTLTGRESRFYIISTLNKVYCDHIQTVMSAIDCVSDCAIVKVPDKDMLYVNKAYVVLKDGYMPDEETTEHIFDLCANPVEVFAGNVEQLKWYEIPTYIEFVPELPKRKGTDKTNYQQLEQDAAEKGTGNKILCLKK